jgi:hypothetical protein
MAIPTGSENKDGEKCIVKERRLANILIVVGIVLEVIGFGYFSLSSIWKYVFWGSGALCLILGFYLQKKNSKR